MIDLTKYQYGDYVSRSSTAFSSSNFLENSVLGKTCIAIPTYTGSMKNEIVISNRDKSAILKIGMGAGPVKFKMPAEAYYAGVVDTNCPITLWYQP